MSQHDFDIANQSAPNARTDINNALKALASLSSGATAPSTTYANMLWYDTSANTLKVRAEADDAWISIGYLDQSTDTFALFDDTKVVNSSGTQTGILGDQAESAWQTGTGTTESLVSPAKIKAAIEALGPNETDLAEGATGAPVVAAGWHPYNSTTVGDGNDGEFYDNATDGNASFVDTPDFEDGYEYKVVFEEITQTGISPIRFRCDFIDEDGTLQVDDITVLNTSSTSGLSGFVETVLPRKSTIGHTGFSSAVNSSDSEVNAINGKFSSAKKLKNIRFEYSAGTINGGKMFLYRRLDYTT